MLASLVALSRLFALLGRAIRDPATRGLVALTAFLLGIGTAFYRVAEGWSVIDALYFSVVTLTTIGFGDLVPTGDGAKLFTMIYSLVGIGVLASFVASMAVFARADWEDRHDRRSGRRPESRGTGSPEGGDATT